jgi:leucine dehydrogenase
MTTLWGYADFDDHEDLHLFTDPASGLRAIIAIHSTHLGPAAGGCRFWHYAEDEEALVDALRLSRGMSYKNAMAGLALGGGKAVILAEDGRGKTPEQLAAFGRAVDSLGGRYVTAEDVGMSVSDMVEIARQTKFVAGLPPEGGEVGGDPGPHTSLGVFLGIKAAVKRALGKDSLRGLHVALQGAGSVATGVALHACAEGAKLSIADVDQARAQKLADATGGSVVPADQILSLEADVLSPCALGAILDERTIDELRVPVVAGGANNQLATAADGARVHDRGILYAPDYVINAGGIINVCTEYLDDGDASVVRGRIEGIPERLEAIWTECAASGRDPATVADEMAQRLIGRG